MSSKKSIPRFAPSIYKISAEPGDEWANLLIVGQKLGIPNKRLTLNQTGLKVRNAQIIYSQKNKQIEHQVTRINHLPSFQQVRLHTASPLYPGNYQIALEFRPANLEKLTRLAGNDLSSVALRKLLPSFDNEEARAAAKIEVS